MPAWLRYLDTGIAGIQLPLVEDTIKKLKDNGKIVGSAAAWGRA